MDTPEETKFYLGLKCNQFLRKKLTAVEGYNVTGSQLATESQQLALYALCRS